MRSAIAAALALHAATVGSPGIAAAERLRIGVAVPLSGPEAIFGDQVKLGVQRAVSGIDAGGGILGRQADMVTGDDAGDAKTGAEVAKGFVASGLDLVVGDFSSAVTVPASAIYAEAGVLDIAPGATEPLVTERGLATVFRTCGREDQQAAAAAKFLLGRHYAKVAILHDRTTVGKGLADGVRQALAGAGVEVFYGSVAETSRDSSGLIARLRAAGTQIVFWGGGPAGAAQLARQLREAGAHIPLFGGLGMASDEFASLAGPAAEGTMMLFPQDPRRRAAAADLLRRLKADGADPGAYVFYAYAAVEVIAQAAEAAHSLAPQALAAAMHSGMTFRTVLGPLAFDDKGDPRATDLAVHVWHKGPTGKMSFSDQVNS